MLAIKVGTIFTPYRRLGESYVVIDKGKIVRISRERPKYANEIHSYEDCMAAPGFVDLHMHGSFGIDIMNASPQKLCELAERLPATGVTSFIPSTVSDDFSRLAKTFENLKEASAAQLGANILGIHLEGPYLNSENRGAHLSDYIRPPSIEEFTSLYIKSQGLLKRVTVAPEVVGGLDFISAVSDRFKVAVSVGHTSATFNDAIQAFDRGATMATHLFNCMRRIDHREPGVVAAALIRPDIFVETIVDLFHLHPATVKLIYRCKGARRMLLVTDAIAASEMPDGSYQLGRTRITVKDRIATLPDGILAGSTLTMTKAIQNAVKIGIPIQDVLAMASDTPCRALKLNRKGRLRSGFDADLVVLDKVLNPVSTYVGGKKYDYHRCGNVK
ncbi:MAG: N-acetylglucosamine-6-phosphate deacetylase [Nitrososphaeria archaeon]